MIYDSLDHIQRYLHLHPNLDAALNYLRGHEWKTLPEGRNELDGERLFANVDRYVSVPEKSLETHARYIDIQCVAEGEEAIGVAGSADLVEQEAYDEARDIAFWQSKQPYTRLPMRPGKFLILFPGEAHAPGLRLETESPIHKVVLKVLWKKEG